jgi:hypothetical protein
MEQNTLIIIVILILLSSQLWNILWDIGKGLLYIIFLILILNYINPVMAENIKDFVKRIFNFDMTIFKDFFYKLSDFILKTFGKNIINKIENSNSIISQSEIKSEVEIIKSETNKYI